MPNKKSLPSLVLFAISIMVVLPASAKDLKFATALPEKSPAAKQVHRFVETIAKESEGSLNVVPYFSSQLGSQNAALAQVARGRIEMGQFTVAAASLQVPALALAQMPFYYDSTEQRDCVLDNYLFEPAAALLAEKNLQLLRWGEVGPLHLPGKVSFADSDSVKGAKIGVISHKINNAFWKKMGANPVASATAEAASSLQTGLIDTHPMPYMLYVPAGISKIAPTMTKIRLWDSGGLWLMNKRAYDRLSENQQNAFKKDREQTPDALLRTEIRAIDTKLTEVHKSQGGTVIYPTDEQRAKWRSNLDSFYLEMAKEIGPEGEAFFEIIETGKKACAGS